MKIKISILMIITIMIFGCDSSNDGNFTFVSESDDIPKGSIYLSESGSSGKTIKFLLSAKDIDDLYGVAFHLTYDSSVVKFVSAEESNFLYNGEGGTIFLALPAEGDQNRAVISLTRVGESQGKSGSGVIAELTFEGIGNGDSPISFENESAINSGNEDMSDLVWIGGTLTYSE